MNEQAIGEQLAVLIYEVKELKIQVTKTNGSITGLQQAEKDGLVSRAEIKKELEFHTKEESRTIDLLTETQKDHGQKIDRLAQRLWVASGAIIGASYLPEIFLKLLQ